MLRPMVLPIAYILLGYRYSLVGPIWTAAVQARLRQWVGLGHCSGQAGAVWRVLAPLLVLLLLLQVLLLPLLLLGSLIPRQSCCILLTCPCTARS